MLKGSGPMKTTGNTILITGGGSGIGRGLAEAFLALGNQVVIAGRRKRALEEATAANPGMKTIQLDIQDVSSIRQTAERLAAEYPQLNVLINSAGIMRREKLGAGQTDLADSEAIIATNLLGPIRLTAALLPLLQRQPNSTIMNVSSGLAFVPLTFTPTYCATKAAIHSYTQSLRHQLRGSNTNVVELIPPYVATDLLDGANDPRAMPLGEYIAEVMQILKDQPDAAEICVERVKGLRFAAENGLYDAAFKGLNDTI
jgi:uncharacterized oxidoreductase